MKVEQNVMENHKHLSQHSAKFLEFAKKNPWVDERAHYEKALAWHVKYINLNPWPTFVSKKISNEAHNASNTVLDLIRKIIPKIFDYDVEAMAEYYGMELDWAKNLYRGVTQFDIDHVIGRGDFLYSAKEGFKCLEFNVSGNLGGGQISVWEQMYRKTVPIATFFKEYKVRALNTDTFSAAFEHYIESLLHKFPHPTEPLNHCMLMNKHPGYTDPRDYMELLGMQLYGEMLKKRGRNLSGDLVICDFPHLEVKNGFIYFKDKKILSFHENKAGKIPDKFLDVYEKNNVMMYNGGIGKFLGNKLNLALLSENQDTELFSPEDREKIKAYIPWTRKSVHGNTTYDGQTVDLYDFISKNRHLIVLKPSAAFGGKGIFVGKETDEAEWDEALKTAFEDKNWVIQLYVEPDSYMYQFGTKGATQCRPVWGIFTFGHTFGGHFLRVMPVNTESSVINSQQGAEVSCIFITDN